MLRIIWVARQVLENIEITIPMEKSQRTKTIWDYMGGKEGSWKKKKLQYLWKKSQRTRIIWDYMGGKAGSGQYRLISRPPLGIICNHRPPTFVCFIPPQTTTTQCAYDAVHLMPPVCLFPFQREWVSPFLPWMGWPWRPCEWGSNEPSTSSQMMSTPLRRFLEWFIKAPTFAPLTPCSKFKQTMTKNVDIQIEYMTRHDPHLISEVIPK